MLTTISASETWTDLLSFSDQSEYEQTINFNPDNSWSLKRTETGSGISSFDQTLISTLTINDEVGSIDDGLGTAFTFTETSNLHSWNDGESVYVESLSLVSTTATDPAETTPPEGGTAPPDNADISIELTLNETGESESGLTVATTGSQSYQTIGGTESADQIEFNANWESSIELDGSGDYEASLAWNSDGFRSYFKSGSFSTEYLITGASFTEYDQGFDSSVDGLHASSTDHFTASGSELVNYAVSTQASVVVPIDDGSDNSVDPITAISQSQSISISGNAHVESDVLDLVHWAGPVQNTFVAADGSEIIETVDVTYDSAISTQSMQDQTYSSANQFNLEYVSDAGLTVSGNQTSQSEVTGSLDISTDISKITTGADQLSTFGVLTNSFHQTFTGVNANSAAYTLTKAVESDVVIAEFLSSSTATSQVTDTNIGNYQESALTTESNPVLSPVTDWNENRQFSKAELETIEFDGETWSLATSGSGSLATNGVYHSTLPDFVAPANTDEAFAYTLNETLAPDTDSDGASIETHTRQFNFTSGPSDPGDGSYQPSTKMEELAGSLDAQFASSAKTAANTDGAETPPEHSPESQGKLRFLMDAFNGLISYLGNAEFVQEKADSSHETETPFKNAKIEYVKEPEFIPEQYSYRFEWNLHDFTPQPKGMAAVQQNRADIFYFDKDGKLLQKEIGIVWDFFPLRPDPRLGTKDIQDSAFVPPKGAFEIEVKSNSIMYEFIPIKDIKFFEELPDVFKIEDSSTPEVKWDGEAKGMIAGISAYKYRRADGTMLPWNYSPRYENSIKYSKITYPECYAIISFSQEIHGMKSKDTGEWTFDKKILKWEPGAILGKEQATKMSRGLETK